MSFHKLEDGIFKIRWREGGCNKSLRVHGSFELAKKVERKKMFTRDENRHLDIRREVNMRMSAFVDLYWAEYGSKKRSADREKSIIEGIRAELGTMFVREVDGNVVARWREAITRKRKLSDGTASGIST